MESQVSACVLSPSAHSRITSMNSSEPKRESMICGKCLGDIPPSDDNPSLVCPKCGTENRPTVQPEKSPQRLPKWAIAGLVVVVLLAVFLKILEDSNKTRNSSHKTIMAECIVGDSALVLKNADVEDWPNLAISINGEPLSGYAVNIPPLKRGEKISIPLSKFTQEDGKRFNPAAYRVTHAWIGGGDYSYSKCSF